MYGRWQTVQEAAEAFRDILNKKLTTFVLADFKLKLFRTVQENDMFRDDMSQFGALVHWTDENHLKWVITKETIRESLAAIEIQYGKGDSNQRISRTDRRSTLEIKSVIEQLQNQTEIKNAEMSIPLSKGGYEPNRLLVPVAAERKTNGKISSSSEDDASKNTQTKNVAGKAMAILTPGVYIKIEEIIPRPKLEHKEKYPIHSVVPFLLQKIKMWGCNALTPEKLTEVFLANPVAVENESNSPNYQQIMHAFSNFTVTTDIQQNENLAPLCKLDIFSCLTAVTEITVLAELFRILSKFPQTLPLVLPNLDNEGNTNATHIVLSPVLQKCLIRWEKADGIAENYLFRSPYKLITAVRLGENEMGKSTILNQLFETSNMFQCRGQPGGQRGTPLAVTSGSVEFIWLIENTCKRSTWDSVQNAQSNCADESEIVLLANLHGDAMKQLDILKAISSMTSHVLLFVMPDAVKDFAESVKTIINICGEKNISFLFVDPPENVRPPSMSVIKTSEILRDETLQKLNKYIKDAVQKTNTINCQPNREKTVKIIDRMETPESEDFRKCINTLNKKLKSQNEGLKDILCLQKHNTNDATEAWSLWEGNENLQQLMSSFVKLIKLPLKSRRLALGHVEQELAVLIATKTAKYAKQLNELIKIRNSYKLDRNHVSKLSIEEVNDQMKNIYVEHGKSLGLEDLLRELGFLYELMTSRSIDLPLYSDLPEYYAELMIEGMTLEILDGDLGTISGNWLEAVCHSVCKKMSKLKVFVISILGLQSSGKSTLLNALFGCKFAVSVGKCTRGLFMRLMMVEKKFRKILNIDAILVVDTEGLGAPESMADRDAEVKDRTMATFAMTISNLTLVNVLGEAKNEIAHIMQIVILTMARMDKADLVPDILLVQHVAEGGQEYKLKQGVSQFCLALDEAVSVSKSEIVNLGVKTLKNLNNIKERISSQELLVQVRPFKSGASPQSPPTEGYHEDIIKLRHQIILELTRKSSSVPFCTWHKLLKSYWNAVQTHNFALRFIDIRQVRDYIEVNGKISTVKSNLDEAFQYHQHYLMGFINEKLSTWDLSKDKKSSKTFDDEIQKKIITTFESLPNNCKEPLIVESMQTKCKLCQLVGVTKHELLEVVKQTSSISLSETEENLKRHIVDLQKSSIARMLRIFESSKIKVGKASEFDKILDEIIQSDRSLVETQSADKIWQELLARVQKKYPIKNIRPQIFADILKQYKQAPDIHSWKEALERVPQTKDDPQPTLTTLDAKKKAQVQVFKKKQSMNLTANEHNWLCGKIAELPKRVIGERNKKQQSYYYSPVMIESHQHIVEDVLHKFEKRFKIKIEGRFRWDAILYSVQILAEQLIEFENEWNRGNEPYWQLAAEKVEYYKKIHIYLEPQKLDTKNANVRRIASSIAYKLLQTAVVVTINAWDVRTNFKNWSFDPESVRLRYLVALAEHIKGGSNEVALEHFRNPKTIIREWYTLAIENIVKDTQIPILKKLFIEENAAIITEVLKTKNSQELNKFVVWYLMKMKERISDSEIVPEEMFRMIKEAIKTELELGAKEYSERIRLENIPLDDHFFLNAVGCTKTCPRCSALCWGYTGHEHQLIRYKNHYTCHQPLGLAGVVDSAGVLVLTSCSDDVVGNTELFTQQSVDEENGNDAVEVPWIKTKHPVDEYSLLMQWFFFKLNTSLAEQYGATPAPKEAMEALGFHKLDAQLDTILNVIRHRSEMQAAL